MDLKYLILNLYTVAYVAAPMGKARVFFTLMPQQQTGTEAGPNDPEQALPHPTAM